MSGSETHRRPGVAGLVGFATAFQPYALSAERRAELKRKGAVELSVEDWLGLDEIDRQVVEFRVRVGREVRRRRAEAELTQAELAKSIGSSQSRVAKVEATADGVGVDLLLRSFFAVGGRLADSAVILAEKPSETMPVGMPKRRKKSNTV